MTTTQKIEAVKNKIGNVHHNTRCAFVNTLVLRDLYQERLKLFDFNLSEHPAPQVLNVPNSANHMATLAMTSMMQELTATKIGLDLAEASDAWKEANGILGPLVAELRQLEAQLAAENVAHGERLRALAEAEESALEKARAAALADPAVLAARRALEAATAEPAEPEPVEPEPVKLTRGRQRLASDEGEEPR